MRKYSLIENKNNKNNKKEIKLKIKCIKIDY
jgi:hypothetical protein